MNTEKLEELFNQNATGFVVGHHVDRAIMKKPFLSLVTSPEFQQAIERECEWKIYDDGEDDYWWKTSCGGNASIKATFCLHCGGRITERKEK